MFGANRTIQVMRRDDSERDAEGRLVPTWVEGDTVRGTITSTNRRELIDGRWEVFEELRALLPASTTVEHRDVLSTPDDGAEYRVESVAARRGPTGAVHHISCNLSRTVA